jgi:hypothetical protein
VSSQVAPASVVHPPNVQYQVVAPTVASVHRTPSYGARPGSSTVTPGPGADDLATTAGPEWTPLPAWTLHRIDTAEPGAASGPPPNTLLVTEAVPVLTAAHSQIRPVGAGSAARAAGAARVAAATTAQASRRGVMASPDS